MTFLNTSVCAFHVFRLCQVHDFDALSAICLLSHQQMCRQRLEQVCSAFSKTSLSDKRSEGIVVLWWADWVAHQHTNAVEAAALVCRSPLLGPFFFTSLMTQSSLWPLHLGAFILV